MKQILLLLILLCTGCSTFQYEKQQGKIYITSDILPTITNDKSVPIQQGMQHRIIINGKIEYKIFYVF